MVVVFGGDVVVDFDVVVDVVVVDVEPVVAFVEVEGAAESPPSSEPPHADRVSAKATRTTGAGAAKSRRPRRGKATARSID